MNERSAPSGYEHTQFGKIHFLLWGVTVVCVIGAYFLWHEQRWAGWVMLGCGGVMAALVFTFGTLTVRDRGDALEIRFGPLPIFARKIPYAAISEPRAARSRLIDGWGIHWAPGRGWTWNLWTFDCVEMRIDGRPFRVGTDDRERLVAFLGERTRARPDGEL